MTSKENSWRIRRQHLKASGLCSSHPSRPVEAGKTRCTECLDLMSPKRHLYASVIKMPPLIVETKHNLLACCGRWHEITSVPFTAPCCGRVYFTQTPMTQDEIDEQNLWLQEQELGWNGDED